MHLDVARNFVPKDQVLKLIDVMAMYKLNKFHFHLTDDEGWRLEIPGLPELTEVNENNMTWRNDLSFRGWKVGIIIRVWETAHLTLP